MTFWRFLVIALLVVNIGLLVQRELAPPPNEDALPATASAPRALAVPEPLSHSIAGRSRCFTLGPLVTEVQSRAALERLRPFVERIRERTTRADQDRGWQVLLRTANREEALRRQQHLSARGIGSSINGSGDLFFGGFQTRSEARARQAELAGSGVDVEVSIVREYRSQFWLDYRIDPEARSPWRAILRASPEAQHFAIPCF